ncbi:MAG: Ig-like domain-containing protein [Spirochaetia bacterium]
MKKVKFNPPPCGCLKYLVKCWVCGCLIGCSPYLSFLHKVPTVEALNPYPILQSAEPISVQFSCDMDRSSVESAWSFSQGLNPIDGSFEWHDSAHLSFTPRTLPSSESCTLRIAFTARSEDGVPMSEPFVRNFSCGDDPRPLQISSITPDPDNLIIDPATEFVISFNKPVSPASFYSAFETSPQIQGSFIWEEDNSRLRFIPSCGLSPELRYQLQITTRCSDTEGRNISETVRRQYEVRSRQEISVDEFRLSSDQGTEYPEVIPGKTYHIGHRQEFSIILSEPALSEPREETLQLQPNPGFDFNWSENYKQVSLLPPSRLDPEVLYRLHLGGHDYYLQWDGEGLQRVELAGVSFCNDTAAESEFRRIRLNELLLCESSSQAAMELAFSHSDAAEISTPQLMQALGLYATNTAAGIQLHSLKQVTNAACEELCSLQPDSVFRLSFAVNRFPAAGLLYLQLDQNLKDSLGNSLAGTVRKSYNL